MAAAAAALDVTREAIRQRVERSERRGDARAESSGEGQRGRGETPATELAQTTAGLVHVKITVPRWFVLLAESHVRLAGLRGRNHLLSQCAMEGFDAMRAKEKRRGRRKAA